MRLKRISLLLLSVIILVSFSNTIEANAMNTGFKTNHLETEEKTLFISNANILLIDAEPAKKSITCFDVNSNRLIAIGQDTLDRKTICIYSSEGVFQYGYTFSCSGDFGVEWDEENLNIYFVRSNMIASVTPSGEILDVFEVQNTAENNSYVNHFIHSTERIIDGTKYYIENNMGILNLFVPAYSQIITEDTVGARSVIYDVSSAQLSSVLTTVGIVSVFVVIAILAIVWQFIKLKHK